MPQAPDSIDNDDSTKAAIEQTIQRDPLVVTFGDHPRTRMLMALLDASPDGLNVTSIVENAGLSARSAWYDHKDQLLATGLVEVDEKATEQAGRATIYRLTTDDERIEWLEKLRDHTGAALRAADDE